MCSLCSRLRRGVLYRVASELGATKIALGHHRDDMVQTLFMNMFFGGRLKAMPPKLVSDDGKHVVIRPLAYVAEADLERWAVERAFPIIPCNLCGSQQNLQRVRIGAMLRDWEREDPGRIDRIFDAMARVVPSHLLDRNLFGFAATPTDRRRRRRRRPRLRYEEPTTQRVKQAECLALGFRPSRAGPKENRHDQAPRGRGRRRPFRLRIARQRRRRRVELQPLADRPRRHDVCVRAVAVAARRNRRRRRLLEDAARRAVEGVGFAPATEAAIPDVTMQIGARITAVDRSPYDDPFWYGGSGVVLG